MNNPPDYRLLVVVSSKKNPNYIKLLELLKDPKIMSQLKAKNIMINENITEDNNFILYLYDLNMTPILSLDKVDDSTLTMILKAVEGAPKASKQNGGSYYRRKYYKYKSKYRNLKGIN